MAKEPTRAPLASPALGTMASAPIGAPAADLAAGEAQTRAVAEGAEPAGLRAGAPVHAASLGEAAAVLSLGPDRRPVDDGGPGVGAAQVAERTEGFVLRPTGTHLAERLREAEAVRRPLTTRDVLPRLDHAVDPDTVPGTRIATASGQIRRHGLTYRPGAKVEVDFRAYLELRGTGYILAAPWDDLPEAGTA